MIKNTNLDKIIEIELNDICEECKKEDSSVTEKFNSYRI